MLRPWIHAYSAGLSAALALGCSSSPAKTGSAPAQCVAPGYQAQNTPVQIDEVDAKLLDMAGAPAPNVPVQVCGLDACFNGASNTVGQTVVTPRSTLLRAAFKYGDGFDFAKLAALLDADATQDLGTLTALALPSYAEGAAFPESGTVTNGDVTLILASGARVSHDLLSYTDDSELVFRSVPIPLAGSARALDPSLGFELGYAFSPVSTTFCPPAGVSVKNSLGWPASTAVEVFVQGLEVDEKWAPYAGWLKVADATVSSDGSTIETTSGGIPILSSIALRRSQP